MPDESEQAPGFEAMVARTNGEIELFSLDDALRDGPVVLAFFPGAYTSVCREELCAFRDVYEEFDALDAEVYGISVDSPYVLDAFREENEYNFPLVSDFNREIIEAYGVSMSFGELEGMAQRAVFVLDEDGVVVRKIVQDDPSTIPDLNEVMAAVEEARA